MTRPQPSSASSAASPIDAHVGGGLEVEVLHAPAVLRRRERERRDVGKAAARGGEIGTVGVLVGRLLPADPEQRAVGRDPQAEVGEHGALRVARAAERGLRRPGPDPDELEELGDVARAQHEGAEQHGGDDPREPGRAGEREAAAAPRDEACRERGEAEPEHSGDRAGEHEAEPAGDSRRERPAPLPPRHRPERDRRERQRERHRGERREVVRAEEGGLAPAGALVPDREVVDHVEELEQAVAERGDRPER